MRAKKILKVVFRLFDTFLTFLIVAAFFLIAVFFISSSNKSVQSPDVLGYIPFVVVTGSMEPAIKTNDIVIVKKTHFSELQEGDIVVYFDKEKNITIIHRIVEIYEGKALAKGDANFYPDAPFPVTQIYGKEVLIIPYIGQWATYFKNHIPLLMLLIAGIVLILIIVIVINKKRKSNKQEESHTNPLTLTNKE